MSQMHLLSGAVAANNFMTRKRWGEREDQWQWCTTLPVQWHMEGWPCCPSPTGHGLPLFINGHLMSETEDSCSIGNRCEQKDLLLGLSQVPFIYLPLYEERKVNQTE